MRILTLILTLLVGGCAPNLVRLGPGECVVAFERESVITAGGDCPLQRLYR